MSIFLHISSALVFFFMLYILRRLNKQRSFLTRLLLDGADWCRQRTYVDYPLVFLQNFAEVFRVEMRVCGSGDWQPVRINVRIFLDFYLKHGIESITMARTEKGGWMVEVMPLSRDKSYLPLAGVFGQRVVMRVAQSHADDPHAAGEQVDG